MIRQVELDDAELVLDDRLLDTLDSVEDDTSDCVEVDLAAVELLLVVLLLAELGVDVLDVIPRLERVDTEDAD